MREERAEAEKSAKRGKPAAPRRRPRPAPKRAGALQERGRASQEARDPDRAGRGRAGGARGRARRPLRLERPAHVLRSPPRATPRPKKRWKSSTRSTSPSRTEREIREAIIEFDDTDLIRLSILDLAQIPEGGTAQTALHRSRELAQHAERLGYHRFWLAEHHNMAGIASAATSVAIGFVAEGTSTIRVGAGGIMLPNHAPLVIAEQFGTLDALYPGRIDLGLGRAPGTDQVDDARAASRPHERRHVPDRRAGAAGPARRSRARPARSRPCPARARKSRCGSSARACSARSSPPRSGLPYAFASHFAPAALVPALQVYRETFRPSAQLEQPHVMLAANVIVADTDDEARRLFTSMQRSFIDGAFRRQRTLLPPPIDSIDDYWQPHERAQLEGMLSCSFIGSPETVRSRARRVRRRARARRADRHHQRLRPGRAAALARAARRACTPVPPYSVEPSDRARRAARGAARARRPLPGRLRARRGRRTG